MSRSVMPSHILSTAATRTDISELTAQRSARWRPGLAAVQGAVCHSEIFASGREASGAAAALVLALDDFRHAQRGGGAEAEDRRAVLWVQTREAARLTGRPYRPGLPAELRARVIHVLAEKAEDALFALEEGVRCRDLAFVLGEIAGDPRALDFTASRRLTLAAERHGVPLYLVRLDAVRDLSSARMRWQVAAAPSAAPQWNAEAPGVPVWHAELFRARAHAPGGWLLCEDKNGSLLAEKYSVRPEELPSLSRRRLEACPERLLQADSRGGQAACAHQASNPSRRALDYAPCGASLDRSSGRTEIFLGG